MDAQTIKYIMIPVIGAIIGLFTNYLAIKMLFRPFKPIKFLGIRLPFTPGVIPKEHHKLAAKIGETVGEHLVTADSLHDLFKKEEVKNKIYKALDSMYDQFGVLSSFITDDIKQMISEKVIGMIDTELPSILDEMDVKDTVSKKVKDFSLERLEEIILSVAKKELAHVTYFGGILGFIIGCVQLLIFVI